MMGCTGFFGSLTKWRKIHPKIIIIGTYIVLIYNFIIINYKLLKFIYLKKTTTKKRYPVTGLVNE
jgi:hypothetical protein